MTPTGGSGSESETDGATAGTVGADGKTDGETDEPPAECPPRDDSVSAAFSVAIDGSPIVIDVFGPSSEPDTPPA